MVIGNAMTAAAVALNRLGDEIADSRARIEATLALGATAREAAAPIVRRALRSGMIALIDSTKTTGLIFFPGTMVGMLLAGAEPTDAVRLQLILLYALLGSVAIAALVATALAYRNFFTPAQQLRESSTYTEPVSRQQRLTLVATILGSTVVFLDATVVNVALPAIAGDLDAGLAGQQWVVEAYMLTLVSLLLVGGSLGDQFGRRRMFVFGLIAFGATSAALRGRALGRVPDRRPRPAGDRRGAAGAGLAGDRRRHLRGRGARQGGRHLDRLDRDRHRARPGRRRGADRGALLAGDLLGQPAADRGHGGADAALGRGEPRPGRLPRHRLARDRALGGRARRARLRPDRAADPRLGRPARLGADGRAGSPASPSSSCTRPAPATRCSTWGCSGSATSGSPT